MIEAQSVKLSQTWVKVGGIAGILSVVSFIGASVIGGILNAPSTAGTILGFAFGPLLVVAFIGLYKLLHIHHESVALGIGTIFGIIAGSIVNVMIVVQDALFRTVAMDMREPLGPAWDGLQAVQLGLDVAWDIFISLATILIGYSMLSHPRFGKIWGGVTSLIGLLLLVFNLLTFPTPPGNAGLIDLGPIMGVWYLIISIQMLRSIGWIGKD